MSPRLDKQVAAAERAASKYGLATSAELRCGVNKYRWNLIERDVNALLARRRDLPTGSPGTIREDVVNYMAGIYLACCRIERVPISENLLHLVCGQLGVASFGMQGPAQKADALAEAKQLRDLDPRISQKALAKRTGASPRSIRRWEESGQLQRASMP